jgi:23S rRNA (pseudouridine1915-N3)-methyltransferase
VKVSIYYVGKARDAGANAMAGEYVKRTSRYLPCEMREIRPERFDPWARHPGASKILLDAAGRTMTSAGFRQILSKAEIEGRDLVFLIGGAEGPPADWKARANTLLSLSAMTFPHEFARVMLAEQIYRAVTGLRGHPYPK